jgi:hypothetical protein
MVCASLLPLAVTDAAAAQCGLRCVGWGWRGPAVAVTGPGYGAALSDYPYGGYGEYAEYGRWAHQQFRGCRPIRQPVLTEDGWLFRLVQICG